MSLSFEQIAQAFWWSLGATELFVAVFVALAFMLCAVQGIAWREPEDQQARDCETSA